MVEAIAAETLAQMQPIFREALDDQGLTVTLDSSAWNMPNWDSLAHIEIIEMVERQFEIRFKLAELQGLKKVGDIVNLVVQKKQLG